MKRLIERMHARAGLPILEAGGEGQGSMKRLIERMRARVAETYRDKPRTATTIHWVEERVCSCGYSVLRWTPEATKILKGGETSDSTQNRD